LTYAFINLTVQKIFVADTQAIIPENKHNLISTPNRLVIRAGTRPPDPPSNPWMNRATVSGGYSAFL
jgi:hypothetical protein